MNNLIVKSSFGLSLDVKCKFNTELYVDIPVPTPSDSYKILLVIEPDEISNIKNTIINNKDKFDVILTWNEEILNECDNSILFPFGSSWISSYQLTQEKDFKITTLVGGKTMLSGHKLRQDLLGVANRINVELDIFNSVNYPSSVMFNYKQISNKSQKNELFYSQYHIAIENVKHNNFFTEKLIDCFQTKTIPIYYGCPNIGNFFNDKGILSFNNLEELINICNNLTKEKYLELTPYIDQNFELSNYYADFKKRLEEKIFEILKKL